MHSSRYKRETSRCMHNMHVICIYNGLRWYFSILAVCERRQYSCSIGIEAVCGVSDASRGYSTVKRHLVMAGAQ
jgi:hypothetical protein